MLWFGFFSRQTPESGIISPGCCARRPTARHALSLVTMLDADWSPRPLTTFRHPTTASLGGLAAHLHASKDLTGRRGESNTSQVRAWWDVVCVIVSIRRHLTTSDFTQHCLVESAPKRPAALRKKNMYLLLLLSLCGRSCCSRRETPATRNRRSTVNASCHLTSSESSTKPANPLRCRYLPPTAPSSHCTTPCTECTPTPSPCGAF